MIKQFKYSDKEIDEIIKSMVILIDTREKANEHITSAFEKNHIAYECRALDCCDYSFYIPANEKLNIPRNMFFDKEIAIERKRNLEEISINLTKERDRFEKELALAPKQKVIIIENANYENIIEGDYNSKYNKKAFLASLHTFWFRYNCPIMFIPDNKVTAIFIKKYFEYYLKEKILR